MSMVTIAALGLSGFAGGVQADNVASHHAMVVVPPISRVCELASVSVAPKSLTGGQSGTVTLTLTEPAPAGGAVVSLVSENRDAAKLSPTSVTIPEGSLSATAVVKAYPVITDTVVVLRGKYVVSHTTHLTVLAPVLKKIQVLPSKVVGGAEPQTGTITLTGPTPQEISVIIGKSNDSVLLPDHVIIHGGKSSATFPVSTKPVLSVETPPIAAVYNGSAVSCFITVKAK